MKDNPPYAADAPILKKLRAIGVEPGKDFDLDQLDPKHAEALNRAAKHVRSEVESAPLQMANVNGWMLPSTWGGTYRLQHPMRRGLARAWRADIGRRD